MTLIIGYGNPLRSDDGFGWAVAEGLEGTPGVEVVATHMLVPELAEALARAETAVFVDARVDGKPGAVRCDAVEPGAERGALGHIASPEGLLGLTAALSGRCPRGFAVSVTGVSFEFGPSLSPMVLGAVPVAIQTIVRLIEA